LLLRRHPFFLSTTHPFILAGDLNAHHHLWESSPTENAAGKSVGNALIESPDALLITPMDLGTRINPSSGKLSTIDLIITSPALALNSKIVRGPYCGSDHLPVITTLNANPIHLSSRPSTWIFDKTRWPQWNKDLEDTLSTKSFQELSDPKSMYDIFTDSIQSSSKKLFRLSHPCAKSPKEPRRPWWNNDCQEAVAAAKKAEKEWRKNPLSSEKRAAWKKATKKRLVIKSKKQAWTTFISNLNPQDGQRAIWTFMKSMIGRGNNSIPIAPSITTPNGDKLTSINDIADNFLDLFSRPPNPQSHYAQDDELLEPIIRSHISNNSPYELNCHLTLNELELATKKNKSKAMGPDLIHNEMIKNLSPNNKKNVLLLFNALYSNAFVPDAWKKAIVIPLPKPDKPADDANSYRPISLTSCFCKIFERIITNRLSWFVEHHNLLGPEQAGFRKQRSTTDHLVKLDYDIKAGFKTKKTTVALFLDISKAYDSVWTNGLLYKLGKLGIQGNCLGWIANFIRNRSICIRLGSHHSDFKPISNCVPQGAVISPILFNLMLYDFPTPPQDINLQLYADDVNFYTTVKRPIDAEITLQPYVDKVAKWGRKWKFKFSASKSSSVVFTRAYKPGEDPLFFLNGQRIPNAKKVKFLGLTMDAKLLWKDHIAAVVNNCVKIKNAFSIISKSSYAPSLKSLATLFKSLVRSRIDYGLIIYGSASKSNLLKIDVAARAILRLILGSRTSTPTEVIYAETGTEPLSDRRDWLSSNYLVNLNFNTKNPNYRPIRSVFNSTDPWPTRCSPCLLSACARIKLNGISLFRSTPGITGQLLSPPAPWSPPLLITKWFPIIKNQAKANPIAAASIFNSLLANIGPPDVIAYTDGSVTRTPPSSSCAIFIPSLDLTKSWQLESGSSIFTAELHGIHQALAAIYALDSSPPRNSHFH
jgi:hypothetical protein